MHKLKHTLYFAIANSVNIPMEFYWIYNIHLE